MNKRLVVAGCALAIGGCGSSSSSPDTGSTATATPSAPALKGSPLSTANLGGVLPKGFTDSTSSAPANAATGKPAELQLTGPKVTGGLKELIRVDQIGTGGTAALKDVEDVTIAAARKRGDTIVSGPDQTTAGGEDAYQYEAKYTTSTGGTARRESILVRGGGSDYAIVFLAAPKVYAADLDTFKGFLGSLTFK